MSRITIAMAITVLLYATAASVYVIPTTEIQDYRYSLICEILLQ